MCGIVGMMDLEGRREVDRALLQQMNDRQIHRGPDGSGLEVRPGLGLGHRRLAIIDLESGAQPMVSADGCTVITYNGEVYNFPQLRRELEGLGYRFRTRCDTEVILYAWKAWGPACVERLRGMFAFAIWNEDDQSLFLARDRLGIKPLYYATLEDGWFAFASELKALQLHPGLPRQLDPRALEEYFAYGYVPDPRTIYQGVFKLAPGERLLVRRGEPVRPERYWDVRFSPDAGIDEAAAREGLIDRLREAVDVRLIADVPLGAFLSGGVDSSAVVAMMAQLMDEPVDACSISFGDPKFNEVEFAREVAERCRARHRVREVDPDDFSLIDRLAGLYDEPYADSSALPTYRVCGLAREQVTVALSGDGGDENFAGYRRYRWHVYEERMRALIPGAVRRPLFGFLGRVYPKLDWAPKIFRAKSTFESLGRDSLEGYFHSVSVMGDGLRRQLYSDRFRSELQGYHAVEVLRRHDENAPHHPLLQVQYLDLKTYLPGDILTKVDRASMAHSLEVRVPILDHPLVEWAATLPPQYKLNGREGKYLFKKALEPYLPESVLYRPKMGFAVPLAAWFRGPLREKVRQSLLGPAMLDSGWFDPGFLKTMVEQHQQGLRDYSAPIWSLLMFESFLRRQ
ncbi:asparagine synthase (glutamine-hydrolysing) [Methylomarinovum caldicuralii]|uniref:asparagine synthase (glutamine-hydrolyzing) n=1 Tax=Methylomarinovum caldicuralii TaxID=438856 RepID=A0AAU9CQB1_9GAMM|nr:XrtA/PEP-CTERM system amidotransferase [Methylomarinovum caldicuralii]BCX82148.1 asparagine synthase (glutamine-hydrolysing) [Methylomarinovum caldicuralii]